MNFNPIIVLFLTAKRKIILLACIVNFNPIIVLFLTQNLLPLPNDVHIFQSYYSLIFNRPHFFSKRAKTIYNLFIHALKFVDYKKCFLFICINKEDKIIENKK